MLQAIIHKKHRFPAGDILDDEGVPSGVEPFSLKEDTLTACVLGRFAYLPNEIRSRVWQAIIDLGAGPGRDEDFVLGPYESIEFWPSWRVPEGFDGVRREPDACVSFANAVIIVEAKRWDAPMQSVDQWIGEIRAFGETREPPLGNRRLFLFALGGLGNQENTYREEALCRFKHEEIAAMPVLLSWRRLWRDILFPAMPKERSARSEYAVLRDIECSLEMHDISTARLKELKDFHALAVRLPVSPDACNILPPLAGNSFVALPDIDAFVRRAKGIPNTFTVLEVLPR